MVRVDLNIFSFAETLTQANQNAELQINSVSVVKKIMKNLKWPFEKDKCRRCSIVG